MSRSRFSISAVLGLAVAAIAFAFTFLREVFVDARPLVLLAAGPRLVLESPEGAPCAAALIHKGRHEAGVARLGALRHR